MATEEIQSPPYPGDGATAQGMLNYLRELRKWVLVYRESMNAAIGRDEIPAVIKIPGPEAYLTQPISSQWAHVVMMRRIREEWDHLVRSYEDHWDCKVCVAGQVMLVHAAAVMINGAFTPYEQRELHQKQHLERMQQAFERLTRHLHQIMQPEGSDDAEEKDDGSF